jgi:hypothetical protein
MDQEIEIRLLNAKEFHGLLYQLKVYSSFISKRSLFVLIILKVVFFFFFTTTELFDKFAQGPEILAVPHTVL